MSYPVNSVRMKGNSPVMGIYTTKDHINIEKQCIHTRYGQLRNRGLYQELTLDQQQSRKLKCELPLG